MQQGLLDYRQPRSVGIQCRLWHSKQRSFEFEYEPAFVQEYTLLIEDPVESYSNKAPPSLKRAKHPSIELEEDKLDDLIANWWSGSFSIPSPPSIVTDDDDGEEFSNDNFRTIHREESDKDDVDYEELFRRLININIYAVAEYMADGEPFCLTDHIVNYFVLFAFLLLLHFIGK
ncbi:hypothetical protein BD408DRAFT_435155 [Parasitella parasitica]|nr:hypothetical protein BD408DRAFT_435155 [Parasitella parasitica]